MSVEKLYLEIEELKCEKELLEKKLIRSKNDLDRERGETMEFRLRNKYFDEKIVKFLYDYLKESKFILTSNHVA